MPFAFLSWALLTFVFYHVGRVAAGMVQDLSEAGLPVSDLILFFAEGFEEPGLGFLIALMMAIITLLAIGF